MVKQKYNFDSSVRPQDDFFGYVNNNWIKNNPIPKSESSWNTFCELDLKSNLEIYEIIKEINKKPDNCLTHDNKLVKDFTTTALLYSNHTNKHLARIDSELHKIASITNIKQLSNYIGYAHKYDVAAFWSDYVDLDDRNSQIHVLRIHQDGLTLPNRDYYLDKDTEMKKIRKKYVELFENLHKLIPHQTIFDSDTIIEIETKLALSSWTEVEIREVEKNYTRFTVQELHSRFPNFEWSEYFKGLGWEKISDNIVVDQTTYIESAINIINSYSWDEIKQYLSWQMLKSVLNWVNDEVSAACFDFFGRVIGGNKEQKPLWKRVVSQTNRLIIAEPLGKEYVKRHFPESSKKAVLDIVEDIRSAYHSRIDKVSWMGEKTKQRAHKKLDKYKILIGYPSIWQDLSKLQLCTNDHISNTFTTRAFATEIELKKVGQKPPVEDWHMNAQVVNAYSDFNQVLICFPAGILQPPFFDPDASYATNLGAIGAVIGHEFTHGFDDKGSQFDENGNISQWQTDAERDAVKKLSTKLVKQADAYETIPGVYLKGELILGEIIADIGGVTLAAEVANKMIGEPSIKQAMKEIFISWSTVSRGSKRKEFAILTAKTDPHPPSKYRVNNVFPHIDEFYTAFDVKTGDKLYLDPEDRVNIW